jgi:hypothetical protein
MKISFKAFRSYVSSFTRPAPVWRMWKEVPQGTNRGVVEQAIMKACASLPSLKRVKGKSNFGRFVLLLENEHAQIGYLEVGRGVTVFALPKVTDGPRASLALYWCWQARNRLEQPLTDEFGKMQDRSLDRIINQALGLAA